MNGFEDIVRDVATRVATRVVICPRWVITSLRPSRPVRDRGVWRRALRESGALADPIVNRGRQKSRARARVREHGACLDLWQFRRGAKKEEAGVKTHRREEWHGRQIYIYIRGVDQLPRWPIHVRSISVKWASRHRNTGYLERVQLLLSSWNFFFFSLPLPVSEG